VVVSCGAANSAKLLLASANDKHPNGLANGSDQVGRNFMFHDSQGNLVADSVQTVQPGHSAFLDLNGAETPGSGSIRSELQPCIKILGNSNEPNTVQVIGSLEVFDNFGPDAGKSRMGWSNHN
jgi:choline dehydrogenase-like flavoprotein